MEVRPEGGFGLIFTLHAFLPTLSWSPGLLGATPAAPAPPHEGQVDLVGQLGGGLLFSDTTTAFFPVGSSFFECKRTPNCWDFNYLKPEIKSLEHSSQ